MCDAQFPKCFHAPSNVIEYYGKTNPNVWLEDDRLAYRAGGADNDLFIIQFLPIYLTDSTRAWLDHLSRNMIDSWEDLKEIFTGNFQGTYVRPDNPWDLKSCRQKSGGSLREYIWCFSRNCHELPKVGDTNVISAFWSSTTYQTLVHKLDRDQPKATKELHDIATRHASGEEAVGAIFVEGDGKTVPSSSQRAPSKATGKGAKKGAKDGKKGAKAAPPMGHSYYQLQ
jgi:hypothetical protein